MRIPSAQISNQSYFVYSLSYQFHCICTQLIITFDVLCPVSTWHMSEAQLFGSNIAYTEDPRYNDSIWAQKFCR